MQVKSKKKSENKLALFHTVTKHKGGTFEITLLHILVILSNTVDVEGVAPSLTIVQVSRKPPF